MSDISFDTARLHVLGLGCERGTSPAEVLALAIEALDVAGIGAAELAAIASIDSRRLEPAILAVAAHFSVPAVFFDAPRLEEETPRLANPSAFVFARVGCHGVAEAAALAAAGPDAELAVAKIKSAHATAAVARSGLQKA
ncbi:MULTISPECIES: cobalamin biosynthesis protein [Rhizobium]|uniref:Cobalamin biosynthesis protein n=1 Tax=Rhizobium changzhiense TaxID=2692317 RepID=A0A7Z0U8U4_9HYPH|nr:MULTISPECIES: cobalamin biosynthesis protein [Rhizobium]MBA5804142.1 cobalamin biosynthesis protein [Rhizobium changzhiense]MBY5750667.1 cobalamin biosynthesis protein [Rhizobium leguminosarum]MCH4546168.1 cobalamin biosynthesis protein [Rhizobium changzhiense]NNU48159.1 cobalamin biosynthesis protein [Rhizobium changzhiense]NZD62234.1 cobalamin biosynthesis protein [Rhizobium changzhiense]